MLDEAVPHEKITQLRGTGANTSLADRSIDIVTLAGSLFYAKSRDLIRELKRVCLHRALVIPYDFEILLDDILRRHGIRPQDIQSDYDHTVNFSDAPDFAAIIADNEQVGIELSADDLAHVLLADVYCYGAFVDKYGVTDPFPVLTGDLEAIGKQHCLKANIYYSAYRLNTE